MDDAPLFSDHGDRNLDWGKKIIKSVGMDMVKLENIRDFLLIWLERCACFYPLCLGFL